MITKRKFCSWAGCHHSSPKRTFLSPLTVQVPVSRSVSDNFPPRCHPVFDIFFYCVKHFDNEISPLHKLLGAQCGIVNYRLDDTEQISRTDSSRIIGTLCWICNERGFSSIHFQWCQWLLIYLSLDSGWKRWAVGNVLAIMFSVK